MKELKIITKKQIRDLTNCPGYIIDYLYDWGRLPVVRASKGEGYPRLYDTKAIEIVKEHLNKQSG